MLNVKLLVHHVTGRLQKVNVTTVHFLTEETQLGASLEHVDIFQQHLSAGKGKDVAVRIIRACTAREGRGAEV